MVSPLKHYRLLLLTLTLSMIGISAFGKTLPERHVLDGVPYVAQLPDHCGPAVLTSALRYWGCNAEQKAVGQAVFSPELKGTHGSEMLLYARRKGFAAYSWKSSVADLKCKLAAGVPVIVLQDMASSDKNGHFRLVVGYDDREGVFIVHDPYDRNYRSAPYDQFEALWRRHGNWSLLVCRPELDTFKALLNDRNPVYHLDLARAYFRRGEFAQAERESRKALTLDPNNSTVKNLLSKAAKANAASRAAAKRKPG